MTTNFDALTDIQLVEQLVFSIPQLPEKDREFATSMANSVAMKRYASEKQRYWLVRLCQRAAGQERVAQRHDVGDLTAINAMFDKAGKNVKWPAVVLGEGAHAIRLSIAGPTAKMPGSINVTTDGPFANRIWFGRITQDGQFTTNPRVEVKSYVTDMLRDFAKEPVRVASHHGRRTGNCCFCSRELRTKESLAVGYGPICAERFGLPWGELVEAA